MPDQKVTLGSLLFGYSSATDAVKLETLEQEDQTIALKGQIGGISNVAWKDVSDEIGKEIGTLLDVGLTDIFLGAWTKYEQLRKYRNAEKYPPDETILVPLSKHVITSIHKPYIEVLVDEKSIARINFYLRLQLSLEGVVLKVRDGKVWEVKAGTCQGEASLTAGKLPLIEQKSINIGLPGTIILRDGIEIPKL